MLLASLDSNLTGTPLFFPIPHKSSDDDDDDDDDDDEWVWDNPKGYQL